MRIEARRQKPEARIKSGRFSGYRRLGAGFTLVELLTVIIIIAILIGILIPMVVLVRRRAYNTGVLAQIASLRQSIDQYYADFNAYPGPVSNQVLGTQPTAGSANFIYSTATDIPTEPTPATNLVSALTGPENLVLGLIGGLTYQTAPSANYPNTGINYDPALVGNGAYSLSTGLPKRFGAYIDTSDLSSAFLSTKNGYYGDAVVPGLILGGSTRVDSPVPEILDRFPNRMPILYIRASVGATMYNQQGPLSDDDNPVVINAAGSAYGSDTGQAGYAGPSGNGASALIRYAQYDISQIIAYTQSYGGKCIGEGKTKVQNIGAETGPYMHGLTSIGAQPLTVLNQSDTSGTYVYPYPAYPYFKDPNSPAYSYTNNTAVLPYPRAKDTYILISAGADRIYGTADDITSFGDVKP